LQTKEGGEKGGVRGAVPAICLLISMSCTVTACISPLFPNTTFAYKNKNKNKNKKKDEFVNKNRKKSVSTAHKAFSIPVSIVHSAQYEISEYAQQHNQHAQQSTPTVIYCFLI
jgi:uncharacterized membrane protein